ncbi:GTP-binding protein [Rhodobacteraceae bacterium N5(2021)]|uniref:GTP-binding protein n=1 Tax=Gymnodinialimonas phycosphaerae TaxID=2841589 RepID=A0A975TYG8_9RHOB|nr:GTP-binding protein [Gymnodinialimonas phycosphaerae]
MTPLPLTVVAGYLGAGKTTFINRLLAGEHGLRLMVLVNDFGAINIDAGLIASADGDTIALTNGCVCCTMGADLFMALGDALDRRPRPDHLIVEASGVADPTRIANAALAEPDLSYAGILTVVDGAQIAALCEDPMIGTQVRDQISCADMVVVSKVAEVSPALGNVLSGLTSASVVLGSETLDLASLLLESPDAAHPQISTPHPAYQGWTYSGDRALSRDSLESAVAGRPPSLYRLKGFVAAPDGTAWEVHAVGHHVSVTPHGPVAQTQLVAIGLASRVDLAEVDAWWAAARA